MIVDCAYYKDRQRQNETALSLERARECVSTGMGFVWLGLKDPTPDEVSAAAHVFEVPELAVEEASEAHARPKLDEHGDHFYGVVKTAWYEEAKEEVHFGHIHVFLGPRYVVTIRHGEAANLQPARGHLEREQAHLLDAGPASVVWAILDQVIDDYEPVVAGIDDDIEEVEQAVFEVGTEGVQNSAQQTQRIYFLKREVIEFHRAVAPLLPPLEALERGAFPQIPDDLRHFFREVGGRIRRIDEQVNSQRELLTSILEANLSLIGVQQNRAVQAISAWAAIVAVPTFFASVWGMNFEHMPELGLRFGYPLALLTMFIATVVLYRFFKRIKWL
jgi:magnesium transporter